MQYFYGVSFAFNILCLLISLLYIERISKKLICDQIWVSFFLASIFRIMINFMNFFSYQSRMAESLFNILNGLCILSAFMSLHHAINRAVNHAEGRLQK